MSELSIEYIVYAAILAAQLILGIVAYNVITKLPGKFSMPIGSKANTVELLQKYMKIYREFNLKVDAQIDLPALAADINFLHVKKSQVYKSDLYTVFYVLYQIILTDKEYYSLTKLRTVQVPVFVLEIILAAISLYLYPLAIFGAILLGLVLLTFSYILELLMITPDSLHFSIYASMTCCT